MGYRDIETLSAPLALCEGTAATRGSPSQKDT